MVLDINKEIEALLPRLKSTAIHIRVLTRQFNISVDDFVNQGVMNILEKAKFYKEDGEASFNTYALLIAKQAMFAYATAERAANNATCEFNDEQNYEHTLSDIDSTVLSKVMTSMLTPLEAKILHMELQGFTKVDIAKAVGMSTKKVYTIRANIVQELREFVNDFLN